MQNPCTPNCPDRNVTCHITCRRYKLFALYCADRRRTRRLENMTTNYTVEQILINMNIRNLPRK